MPITIEELENQIEQMQLVINDLRETVSEIQDDNNELFDKSRNAEFDSESIKDVLRTFKADDNQGLSVERGQDGSIQVHNDAAVFGRFFPSLSRQNTGGKGTSIDVDVGSWIVDGKTPVDSLKTTDLGDNSTEPPEIYVVATIDDPLNPTTLTVGAQDAKPLDAEWDTKRLLYTLEYDTNDVVQKVLYHQLGDIMVEHDYVDSEIDTPEAKSLGRDTGNNNNVLAVFDFESMSESGAVQSLVGSDFANSTNKYLALVRWNPSGGVPTMRYADLSSLGSGGSATNLCSIIGQVIKFGIGTAVDGSASTAAKCDHEHDIPVGSDSDVQPTGTSNDVGDDSQVAYANHVHKLSTHDHTDADEGGTLDHDTLDNVAASTAHLLYLRSDGSRLLTGNQSTSAGVLIDNVDIDQHIHDGGAGDAPQLTLNVANSDVNLAALADNDFFQYDAGTSKWINTAIKDIVTDILNNLTFPITWEGGTCRPPKEAGKEWHMATATVNAAARTVTLDMEQECVPVELLPGTCNVDAVTLSIVDPSTGSVFNPVMADGVIGSYTGKLVGIDPQDGSTVTLDVSAGTVTHYNGVAGGTGLIDQIQTTDGSVIRGRVSAGGLLQQ